MAAALWWVPHGMVPAASVPISARSQIFCASSLLCRLQTLGFLHFGSSFPAGLCCVQPLERQVGGCRDVFVSCSLFFLAGATSPCPVSLPCSLCSGQLPFPSVWRLSGDPQAPLLGHHSSRMRMAPKRAGSSCAPTDPVSIPSLNHLLSARHHLAATSPPSAPKLPDLHHKPGKKP